MSQSSAADAVDTNSKTMQPFKRFVLSSGEINGSKQITLHPWKAINWSSSINLVHAFSSLRLSSRWDGNAKFIEQWMERSLYSGTLSLAVHQHGRMSESTMKKHVKLAWLTSLSSYALCRCGWWWKKNPLQPQPQKEQEKKLISFSFSSLSVEARLKLRRKKGFKSSNSRNARTNWITRWKITSQDSFENK